jgi:hypothetical protein
MIPVPFNFLFNFLSPSDSRNSWIQSKPVPTRDKFDNSMPGPYHPVDSLHKFKVRFQRHMPSLSGRENSMNMRITFLVVALLAMTSGGCGLMQSDSSRIVGRWTHSIGLGVIHVYQFYSDSRLEIETPVLTNKGKYSLASGRLELETEGLLWGTNKVSWKYEFKGDTLRIYDADKAPGIEILLTRVK